MPLKIEIDINEAKEMLAIQASHKYDIACNADDLRVFDADGDEIEEIFFKADARRRAPQTGAYDR